MNVLSYGLLSLLSHAPLSGYDLMLRIQPFWPAKHSQIYPLLATLEANELIRYERIEQNDRPDKKVYSLTGKGTDALREWLSEPAGDPALRDELMLKAICLQLADTAAVRRLFDARLAYHRQKNDRYAAKIRELEQAGALTPGVVPSPASPYFGIYVLLEKAQRSNRTNQEWCEWVLGLLPEANAEAQASSGADANPDVDADADPGSGKTGR